MNEILEYLRNYKGKQGLYIIKPKSIELLRLICGKLKYDFTSDIAYIGKAELTKSSDLYVRSKQEMGWSNFEGATFVRKIGLYLDFDIKDKKNKILTGLTKAFICDNFTIECIILSEQIQNKETELIQKLKPCLNNKKKS